jgi:O-antigen ligase/cytochrome c-type biogenesis protein CcmH/NrfG
MNTTNKALRYIIYVLLGATLFVPLIVGDGINHIGIPFASMFFPFITGKAFAFRILVEVAFAVWVILACRDKNTRPKISALTVGVTVFTLMALLVDLTGVNPIRSLWSNFERMEGWVTIIHLWAYFIVFTSVMQSDTAEKTRQLWHRFFNISFIAAFFVALWGILQLTGHLPIQQSGDRLDASIGNAEYLAVYMLINGFLALYMAVVAWGKKKAAGWIYIALAFLYFIVLWFTQTRGTTLALVFGLFAAFAIFAFVKDKNHHTHDTHVSDETKKIVKRERVIAGTLVIAIVIIVGGFWAIRNTHFVQSHVTLQRLASISVDNARIEFIWPEAWQGFKEKPILGWGQENFNYVFNQFYNPEAWAQEQWFDRAHNVFIDWAMNGGIVGFGAYVALFILALVSVWKSDFNIKERAILTSLLIAYAIHNMFVFDNLASYIMFFLALAFLSSEWHARRKALASAHTAGGHADTAAQPGRLVRTEMKLHSFDINNDVTNWVIVPIVIVLGLWIIYFINVRAIDQNLNLISAMENCQGAGQTGAPALDPTLFTKAEQGPYLGLQEIHEQVYSCAEQVIGAQQGVTNDVKLAYYQLASDAFTTQTKMTPNDLRGYLFAGSFYNDLGQWSVALPYLTRAYQLSPVKQSVLFALAQNDINGATTAASTTDAVALLAKAYNEAPDYPQAQTSYAQGLFITKQYAAAQALLEKIIAATPSDLQSTMMLAASDEYLKEPAASIALLQVVASSSPSDAPTIAKYESQIKQGINPFIPPAQTSAAGAAPASAQ